MLYTALKVFGALVFIFAVYLIYTKFLIPYMERSRLIKQGVVYMDRPFLDEISGFANAFEHFPNDAIMHSISKRIDELKTGGKTAPV